MTKEEFLARCAMIYDLGLAAPETLTSLERGADVLNRLADSAARGAIRIESDAPGQAHAKQRWIAAQLVIEEGNRIQAARQDRFTLMTLASDPVGYGAVRIAAILNHSCQQCATDPLLMHTRSGLCAHRDQLNEKVMMIENEVMIEPS
ncbi:hypothetical protein CCAX7_54880 [Capsulimonas corticalis]|uniref:Uncharacterized protein n=1 Tax=Capsulimonas corticalis TaxID=2219043 RepID=A0A402D5R1_9BACT|nr:hypothetical protein [Capsulimonas corticalis]BDI33437.1 hypothetical protein CCAX7_54880 [Capsulimonas corticalis]